MPKSQKELIVASNSFKNEGTIPIKFTGRGEDISPNLKIINISPEAKSIAIIMDDIDHPLFGIYNHWVIWNIPVQENIPEGIPHGKTVDSLFGAVQGIAYGRNRYRGPKPPFGTHRYKYNVYILDCMLNLDSKSRKKDLLQIMNAHVIQYSSIVGKFK